MDLKSRWGFEGFEDPLAPPNKNENPIKYKSPKSITRGGEGGPSLKIFAGTDGRLFRSCPSVNA